MKTQTVLNHHWSLGAMRSTDEKVSLRYGLYKKSERVDRYVVFLNGRNEWIEKNASLADDLGLPEHCGFLTWDHRGQGGSGGVRAHIDSYDVYARDAAQIINEVIPTTPYVFVAHSMGGLIALFGVLKNWLHPQRQVFCAPLFRMPDTPLHKALAEPLSRQFRKIGLAQKSTGGGRHEKHRFSNNKLTHDYDMFQMAKQSPYRLKGATFGWVSASFDATRFIFDQRMVQQLQVPTLILSSGEERVVDPQGHFDWAKLASKQSRAEVELEVIHGARHELFSEIARYRSVAIKRVRNWLADFLDR